MFGISGIELVDSPHPMMMGETPIWWWDANDLASGAVSSWISREGNGYDLAQATSTKRPTCNLTGYNNHPCVEFDGVDDYLLATVTEHALSTFTMFMVLKNNNTSGVNPNAAAIYNSAEANDYNNQKSCSWGENYNLANPRNQAFYRLVGATNIGFKIELNPSQMILCSVFNGLTGVAYLNGTAGTAETQEGNFGIDRVQIGARWLGSAQSTFNEYEVSEIVGYASAFSATKVSLLNAYFYNKWGIARP